MRSCILTVYMLKIFPLEVSKFFLLEMVSTEGFRIADGWGFVTSEINNYLFINVDKNLNFLYSLCSYLCFRNSKHDVCFVFLHAFCMCLCAHT